MSILVRYPNLILVISSLIIYHSDLMTSPSIYMGTAWGTGYLQQKFSTYCPKACGMTNITKETLGLRKLAIDLVSDHNSFLA